MRPKFKSTFDRFGELMSAFGALGKWRISRVGSREYDSILKASLGGKAGRVEVWGGSLHRREVWFVGKNGTEMLVAANCHGDDLASAIEHACTLAGIQRRLFADAH